MKEEKSSMKGGRDEMRRRKGKTKGEKSSMKGGREEIKRRGKGRTKGKGKGRGYDKRGKKYIEKGIRMRRERGCERKGVR